MKCKIILLPPATTVREAVPQANAQLEEYGKMCAEVLPKYIQVRYPPFSFYCNEFFLCKYIVTLFLHTCCERMHLCIYSFLYDLVVVVFQ